MKKLPIFISGVIFGLLISISSIAVAANTDLVAKIFERKIVIDGTELKLEESPLLINSKTYLPVRNLAEGLGYSVSLDSKKIELKSSETKAQQDVVSNKKPTNVGSEYVADLYNKITTDDKLDLEKIKEGISSGSFTINAQDKETGNSLYHYATLQKDADLYSYLKSSKANASLQDKNGRTPLHLAVIEENSLFLGLFTTELRVTTQIEDNDGKKPIDYTKKNSTFERTLKNYNE